MLWYQCQQRSDDHDYYTLASGPATLNCAIQRVRPRNLLTCIGGVNVGGLTTDPAPDSLTAPEDQGTHDCDAFAAKSGGNRGAWRRQNPQSFITSPTTVATAVVSRLARLEMAQARVDVRQTEGRPRNCVTANSTESAVSAATQTSGLDGMFT